MPAEPQSAARMLRERSGVRAASSGFSLSLSAFSARVVPSTGGTRTEALWQPSRCDRFLVGRLPTPGARPIAALADPLLVDLRDDLAVAGQQRLGRAHLGAQRQLAFDQAIAAILGIVRRGVLRIRSTRAIRTLVHLAA